MLVHPSIQLRAKAVTLAITLASISPGFGQVTAQETADRVLQFTHISDPQSVMEAATVIRSTGEIRQTNVDASSGTLTLRATAGQIALAEWMIGKLDQPSTAKQPAMQEYRMPGTPEGVVRIFYPAHAETLQSLQELTTVIRSITEIRRAFTINALKAIVLRGTSDQLAMADWLFNALDQKTVTQPTAQEYLGPGTGADVVRVFYLTQAKTLVEFQENFTLIRRTTKILRMFTYNPLRAIAVRGTADQVTEAERLIKERHLMASM